MESCHGAKLNHFPTPLPTRYVIKISWASLLGISEALRRDLISCETSHHQLLATARFQILNNKLNSGLQHFLNIHYVWRTHTELNARDKDLLVATAAIGLYISRHTPIRFFCKISLVATTTGFRAPKSTVGTIKSQMHNITRWLHQFIYKIVLNRKPNVYLCLISILSI